MWLCFYFSKAPPPWGGVLTNEGETELGKLVRHDESLNYTWGDREARMRFKRGELTELGDQLDIQVRKRKSQEELFLLMEIEKVGRIDWTWVFKRRWGEFWQLMCLQNIPRCWLVGFKPKVQEGDRIKNKFERKQVVDEFVGSKLVI